MHGAGATTSIPTSAIAVRTAVAMATAPGESPWMQSVSTQRVSTDAVLGHHRATGQAERLRRRLRRIGQHGTRLAPAHQPAVGR